YRERGKAQREEAAPGFAKAGRRGHPTVVDTAAGAVAGGVQRPRHLGREAPALRDDVFALLSGEMGVRRQLEESLDAQVLPQGEVERPQVSPIGVDAGRHLVPPHSMPATARTRRMRVTARSGSRRRPASSARMNSSARWTTDRALSSPPTIRK